VPGPRKPRDAGIKVFIALRQSVCGECGENLGEKAWVTLAGERGALCLTCADLDHLVFLPSGDVAVTVRARRYSTLSAVVLRWSRARQRYERQGLLVEEAGLDRAQTECLADAGARAARQVREAARRAGLDQRFVAAFAQCVRERFGGCPAGRERAIAEHACERYSGRVGRSAAARRLDDEAIRLAVVAHIRHTETPYDSLLAAGADRHDARARVAPLVDAVLDAWSRPRERDHRRSRVYR
jgi:hypothetical protein